MSQAKQTFKSHLGLRALSRELNSHIRPSIKPWQTPAFPNQQLQRPPADDASTPKSMDPGARTPRAQRLELQPRKFHLLPFAVLHKEKRVSWLNPKNKPKGPG